MITVDAENKHEDNLENCNIRNQENCCQKFSRFKEAEDKVRGKSLVFVVSTLYMEGLFQRSLYTGYLLRKQKSVSITKPWKK